MFCFNLGTREKFVETLNNKIDAEHREEMKELEEKYEKRLNENMEKFKRLEQLVNGELLELKRKQEEAEKTIIALENNNKVLADKNKTRGQSFCPLKLLSRCYHFLLKKFVRHDP